MRRLAADQACGKRDFLTLLWYVRRRPMRITRRARAAFLSIGLILAINNLKLVADKLDAVEAMLGVAAGEMDERGLSAWIEKNSVRR